MINNPFAVLNVQPDATDKQVGKAFRQLAKKYHPDINKDSGAREQFAVIRQAYQVLKFKNSRQKAFAEQKQMKETVSRRRQMESKRRRFADELEQREKTAARESSQYQQFLSRRQSQLKKQAALLEEEQRQSARRQAYQAGLKQSQIYLLVSSIKIQWRQDEYDQFILKEIFSTIGPVMAVEAGRGQAVVRFSRLEDSQKAVDRRAQFPEFEFSLLAEPQRIQSQRSQLKRQLKLPTNDSLSTQNLSRLTQLMRAAS